MKRTTLKEIKRMATTCIDITTARDNELKAIRECEGDVKTIILSVGTYGINGKILQGYNTKQLYAITKRTPAMWYFC